jgi:hypothetical protein
MVRYISDLSGELDLGLADPGLDVALVQVELVDAHGVALEGLGLEAARARQKLEEPALLGLQVAL